MEIRRTLFGMSIGAINDMSTAVCEDESHVKLEVEIIPVSMVAGYK